jgi:hypothetical protein
LRVLRGAMLRPRLYRYFLYRKRLRPCLAPRITGIRRSIKVMGPQRGVVLGEPGAVALEEITVDAPAPGEVLVRI